MKTNELENREIVELISEITEKGWERMGIEFLEERTGFIGLHSRPLVCVSVTNHDLPDDENEISIEAGSLVECLGLIVDSIRHQRGEPSLAEEVAALILQQEQHESVMIYGGPVASCVCGCVKPLNVPSKIMARLNMQTGQAVIDPNEPGFELGAMGACPDCGLWYQLNA